MPAGAPKRLNWKWEELVLACDLVMQGNGRILDDTDPRVIQLSEVLRQMTLHPQEDVFLSSATRTGSLRRPATSSKTSAQVRGIIPYKRDLCQQGEPGLTLVNFREIWL
jgi:hypothetical protein